MRFSTLALSTLVAQAAARAVPIRARDVDYSGVDYSKVDYSKVNWSNIDWSKVDYGNGGNKNKENKTPVTDNTSNKPTTENKPAPVVVSTETTKDETENKQNDAPATTTTAAAQVTTQPAAQPTKPATTPSQPSTGNGNLSSDKQSALAAHNAARSAVNTNALEWDDGLAADAQAWADNIANLNALQHSSGSGEGENLYMQSGSDNPMTNAVNAFVSEKSSYTAGLKIDGSNFHTFGHYTQAVWKDTTKVGMAVAKSADGASYVVARYSPPGNFIGQTPY